MIITLGIYAIYWYYVTTKEMLEYQGLEGSPGLWTFLLFIPFGAFFSYWKHSKLVESISDSKYNAILVYVLWFFFNPAVWAITQLELNSLATEDA